MVAEVTTKAEQDTPEVRSLVSGWKIAILIVSGVVATFAWAVVANRLWAGGYDPFNPMLWAVGATFVFSAAMCNAVIRAITVLINVTNEAGQKSIRHD